MPVGPYGALLDAVRGVRWPARRPVPGGAPGAHVARTRGVAPEFAEYRPYRQGDDPRRIDWKLLARSDRAFIRLAPDQAILGTSLVVDASASMAFPEGEAGKWGLAKRLSVGLAAVAHASADPVGLMVASGGGARRLDPRTRRGVVSEIARTLDGLSPNGSALLAPLVLHAAARIVVLTDCLGDLDELRVALARHVARRGEAILVHLVATAELEPALAPSLATDPENALLRRPLVKATRDGYRTRFDEFRFETARAFRADGVEVHEVRDDEAAEVVVRRIVRLPGGETRR
jgi:uncharacterized protein (DUF58 family)